MRECMCVDVNLKVLRGDGVTDMCGFSKIGRDDSEAVLEKCLPN